MSKVEKVIIKRFDNDRSEICMIELITDNPNANLNYDLCIGDVRISEFIISPDFRLAGFAMLPVASGSTFVPVVYRKLGSITLLF